MNGRRMAGVLALMALCATVCGQVSADDEDRKNKLLLERSDAQHELDQEEAAAKEAAERIKAAKAKIAALNKELEKFERPAAKPSGPKNLEGGPSVVFEHTSDGRWFTRSPAQEMVPKEFTEGFLGGKEVPIRAATEGPDGDPFVYIAGLRLKDGSIIGPGWFNAKLEFDKLGEILPGASPPESSPESPFIEEPPSDSDEPERDGVSDGTPKDPWGFDRINEFTDGRWTVRTPKGPLQIQERYEGVEVNGRKISTLVATEGAGGGEVLFFSAFKPEDQDVPQDSVEILYGWVFREDLDKGEFFTHDQDLGEKGTLSVWKQFDPDAPDGSGWARMLLDSAKDRELVIISEPFEAGGITYRPGKFYHIKKLDGMPKPPRNPKALTAEDFRDEDGVIRLYIWGSNGNRVGNITLYRGFFPVTSEGELVAPDKPAPTSDGDVLPTPSDRGGAGNENPDGGSVRPGSARPRSSGGIQPTPSDPFGSGNLNPDGSSPDVKEGSVAVPN